MALSQRFGPTLVTSPLFDWTQGFASDINRSHTRLDHYGIVFDPKFTLGSGENKFDLYTPYLDEVNKIIKGETGTTVNFNATEYWIDKKKDNRQLDNYNHIQNFVEKQMNKNGPWKSTVLSKSRDDLVALWADKLYGLQSTVYGKLPDELSDEARSSIDDVTRMYMNSVAKNIMTPHTQSQLDDWRNPRVGLKKSSIDALKHYTQGAATMSSTPWMGLDGFGDEVFEGWLKDLGQWSDAQQSATGIKAMSLEDVFASEETNIFDVFSNVLAHGIQSFPMQAPSITAGGLSLLGGAGVIPKALMYGAGATAIAAGALGETGSMQNEMFSLFTDLKGRAKAARPFIGVPGGISQKQFDHEYGLKYNDKLVSADQLGDDDLRRMADASARTYGLLATIVESAQFGMTGKLAGANRGLYEWMKKNPSQAVKTLFKNKHLRDTGTGMIMEGAEEGIQTLTGEWIKSYEMPDHHINLTEILESTVIGGVFGGAMGFGTSFFSAKTSLPSGGAFDPSMPGTAREQQDIKQLRLKDKQGLLVPHPGRIEREVIDKDDSEFGGDDLLVPKGGYDNALVFGSHVSPSTVIRDVAVTWGVPEDEVAARYDALLREENINTSLERAKEILKENPDMAHIFDVTSDPNYKYPWHVDKEVIVTEDEDLPWYMREEEYEEHLEDQYSDLFDDSDPDISDGLDEMDGLVDQISIQEEINDLTVQLEELKESDDPSVITPQMRSARIQSLQDQIGDLKSKLRSGPANLQTNRHKQVQKRGIETDEYNVIGQNVILKTPALSGMKGQVISRKGKLLKVKVPGKRPVDVNVDNLSFENETELTKKLRLDYKKGEIRVTDYVPSDPFHYEVSSKGDKRFSALNAKLSDGRSIEEAYQLDVKGYRALGMTWVEAKRDKGKNAPNKLSGSELREAYQKLWDQWAEENPDLLDILIEASEGRSLTDAFSFGGISQAVSLAKIISKKTGESKGVTQPVRENDPAFIAALAREKEAKQEAFRAKIEQQKKDHEEKISAVREKAEKAVKNSQEMADAKELLAIEKKERENEEFVNAVEELVVEFDDYIKSGAESVALEKIYDNVYDYGHEDADPDTYNQKGFNLLKNEIFDKQKKYKGQGISLNALRDKLNVLEEKFNDPDYEFNRDDLSEFIAGNRILKEREKGAVKKLKRELMAKLEAASKEIYADGGDVDIIDKVHDKIAESTDLVPVASAKISKHFNRKFAQQILWLENFAPSHEQPLDYIKELWGAGKTAAQIADKVVFPKEKIYYHVKALLDNELLYIADTEMIHGVEQKKFLPTELAYKMMDLEIEASDWSILAHPERGHEINYLLGRADKSEKEYIEGSGAEIGGDPLAPIPDPTFYHPKYEEDTTTILSTDLPDKGSKVILPISAFEVYAQSLGFSDWKHVLNSLNKRRREGRERGETWPDEVDIIPFEFNRLSLEDFRKLARLSSSVQITKQRDKMIDDMVSQSDIQDSNKPLHQGPLNLAEELGDDAETLEIPGQAVELDVSSILNKAKSKRTDEKPEIDKKDINTAAKNVTGSILNKLKRDKGKDGDQEKYFATKDDQLPVIEYKGKTARKLDRTFENMWKQFKDKKGYNEASFDDWTEAMDKAMAKLPYRENFRMWHEKRRKKGTIRRQVAKILRSRTDNVFADELMDTHMEQIPYLVDKEMESDRDWGEVEDTALTVKDYSRISRSFFIRFDFTDVDAAKIQKMNDYAIDLINLGVADPFGEFVNSISDYKFLHNNEGFTVAELLDKSRRAREAFKKYWIMLLPENVGTIHRGVDGEIIQYEAKIDRWDNQANDLKSEKPAFKIFRPTSGKYPSLNRKPHPQVETKRFWTRHNPENLVFSTLHKTDLVDTSKQSVYSFLTGNELMRLWQERLRPMKLVPISTRGEDGTLIMVNRLDLPVDVIGAYFDYSMDEYRALKESGEITSEQLVEAEKYFLPLRSPESMGPDERALISYVYKNKDGKPSIIEYLQDWITRHEALKMLFSPMYIYDTSENIAKRIKVPFTPVFTSPLLEPRRKMYIDADGAFMEIIGEDGSVIKSNPLFQEIDGKPQYIGDGATFGSEVMFKEEYPEAFGNSSKAMRLKTVHYTNSDYNVDVSKHDEKALVILRKHGRKATARIVDANGKVLALFKRDSNGYLNIYHPDNLDEHIHYISTNDEAKIRTGKYRENNVVHELPGNSIGIIQFTGDKVKGTGMLSTQISYFLKDQAKQNALMEFYLTDESSPHSPKNKIRELLDTSKTPGSIDAYILGAATEYLDVIPQSVEELANLGAGFFPSQLQYLREVLKNKILKPIADFRTDGSYLDFRPDWTGDVKDDEIVMPYNSKDQNAILGLMDIERKDFDNYQEMYDAINDWLSINEYHNLSGRSPFTSERALGIYQVIELNDEIGDSFIPSARETKERHEGDHDFDHAHITRLDADRHAALKDFVAKTEPLGMDDFERDPNIYSLNSFDSQLAVMQNMVYGETAIGEIVNIMRYAGILSQMFGDTGSMTFELGDGRVIRVKIRGLSDQVQNPAMVYKADDERDFYRGDYAGMLRRHLQAALDHPKLLLLNHWKYTRNELLGTMFYDPNSPSSLLPKSIMLTLKSMFINPILKINSMVDNMIDQDLGRLKFNDVFLLSSKYSDFMQDREGTLLKKMEEAVNRATEQGNLAEWKDKYAELKEVEMIADESPVSLQEVITGIFSSILENQGFPLEQFYNINEDLSQQIHTAVTNEMYNNLESYLAEHEPAGADISKELNNARGYANALQNSLFAMINSIEQVKTGADIGEEVQVDMEPEFKDLVSAKSWDHSDQFIKFHEKWTKIYDNLPSDFQKRIATLVYLKGLAIDNTATGQKQIRKKMSILPPVKGKYDENGNVIDKGGSTLHPAIIADYFKRFNQLYMQTGRGTNEAYAEILSQDPVDGIQRLRDRYCG